VNVKYNYLVALDISAIHEYIFGTNKLREMRGASILIDNLNREISINKLKECKFEDTDYKCVLAGGGNIKVLFSDINNAEKYKDILIKAFKDMLGVKFAIVLSKRNDESDKQWLKRVVIELQIEKDLPKTKYQIISTGYFKACQACGKYPAEEKAVDERFICKSCYQKIEKSKEFRQARIYKKLFDTLGFEPEFSPDFNKIGKVSEPEGYIGFIYADGNRMGTYLADIETFDELEEFSKDVDEATINATVSTLTDKFENELLDKKKDVPFQIILAGGDDLILALPANKAIDVAIDFCENFENNLSSRSITTSASIIICHDSFPIKNVLDIAESLIKNAKAESRKNMENKNGKSYLDFIVITGSSLEDPIAKREKELQYHNIFGSHHLTKRPYSLTEMEDLIVTIQELKKSEFPNNKLKALYASLFKGHIRSVMDAQYLKMRLKKEHKEALNKFISESNLDFPWEEEDVNIYKTSIGDIIELYKFIEVD